MPLSSNTLIHLTREKSSLQGILEDNFQVNFCRERYSLDDQTITLRVPMVSFCDIPLSQIKNHLDSYGSYGIGLTKEWAARQRLNPVLYVESNSLIAASYNRALNKFVLAAPVGTMTEEQYDLADLLRYIKNYEGPLYTKTIRLQSYRFSDEREWRYVPPREDYGNLMETDKSFQDHNAAIASAISHLRLTFEPNDIKYIIIKDDSEITEFVNHLRSTKGKKYSFHDVERLTTRILTTEQILGDI